MERRERRPRNQGRTEREKPGRDFRKERPERPDRPESGRADERTDDRPRYNKPRTGGGRADERTEERPRYNKPRTEGGRADERTEDRPRYNKPRTGGGRADERTEERPRYNKPRTEGGRTNRNTKDRPRYNKPRTEGGRADERTEERPRYNKPRTEGGRADGRTEDRPRYNKPRTEGGRADRRTEDKPRYNKPRTEGGRADRRTEDKPRYNKPRTEGGRADRKTEGGYKKGRPGRESEKRPFVRKEKIISDLIRLNKFIADAGICSRREADKLIETGAIKVNGVVVTQLGSKVNYSDKVQYGDQTLNREKLRYVLLNKPKGYITTTDDPQERKTVMTLIEGACKERIYPVGRLDRNTTGLLLFTNDGALAKKLSHPKYGIRKVYHVEIEKNLTKKEMELIAAGIELDDGFIKVDAIDYAEDGKDKKQIGIELHSGKNRVVRRIFEKLEHKVIRLDRVAFAGLTKKNIPRGTWRFLEQKEISFLKMLS